MSEEVSFDEAAPWLLIPIIVLGGFLRVLFLDGQGMWLDETFSVWMASHSIAEMLQWTVQIDQHPPLYYLLLHYWVASYGDAPYYARLFSVLFSLATIPVMYLIGRRISSAEVGLAAAVFMALSLFNIHYARETRMYTLLAFTAAAATYALVRLLTDPHAAMPIGSQFRQYLQRWHANAPAEPPNDDVFRYAPMNPSGRRWWLFRRPPPVQAIATDLSWAAFIVFSAATLLVHNTAIFFPLAVNLFVIGLVLYHRAKPPGPNPGFQPPAMGNWVKAQAGIFLLWSPWLLAFIQQVNRVDQRFWIPAPTWEAVVQVLKSFLYTPAPLPANQAMVIWPLYGVVFCLGLLHFRKRLSQFLFLAALFAIPILGELIISIRRPIFYDRTLIWATIPLYLILAAGVAQLKIRPLVFLLLGVFATLNVFSAGDYYRYFRKEDWNSAASYVAYYAEEDDLILFNSNFVVIPFNYYFRPFENKWQLQVEKQGVPFDLFEHAILEPEMTEKDIPRFREMLRGHPRVWLVYSHNSYTDPKGLVPQTLSSQMRVTRTREFYGGQVQLYETH
jgi:hypothetical protein